MEINKRAHPECVYAANRYHECNVTCLEKISAGQGRNKTEKQAWRLLSFNKKKEYETPKKPQQEGSFKAANYPAKDPPIPLSHFLQIKLEKKSFSSSNSFQEPSGLFYTKKASFDDKPDRLSVPTTFPELNLFVQKKDEEKKPSTIKQETGSEINSAVVAPALEVARNFCSLSPPRPLSNDESNSDEDHEEEDEEIKSVISDSCVFVGKYQVQTNVSSVLQSILDKHGDIASNCKLQSPYILSRYLECVCSVVQELQSTRFENLNRSKVLEMSAVLKDMESVDIDVAWLRSVLEELMEVIEARRRYQEKEMLVQLVESTRKELGIYEESLVRKEKEVVVVKRQVDETRARLAEVELEALQLKEMELKIQKLLGKSINNVLL